MCFFHYPRRLVEAANRRKNNSAVRARSPSGAGATVARDPDRRGHDAGRVNPNNDGEGAPSIHRRARLMAGRASVSEMRCGGISNSIIYVLFFI
jgi:hypothetical protein